MALLLVGLACAFAFLVLAHIVHQLWDGQQTGTLSVHEAVHFSIRGSAVVVALVLMLL